MANQVEIRIQVDDGGSSTATASRFDSALASMTEQQKLSTAEMIKNTHELGMQTQVEVELIKLKYLDMFDKVRASGLLTASELQAVNTKIAGIKMAENMNQLNDAIKWVLPTKDRLITKTLTLAESVAFLRSGYEALITTQFGVNEATARMERQLIFGAAKAAAMAVSIGAVAMAYKDANMFNEDMQKSTDKLHNAFIGLREELANGLAPTFVLLNEGMAITMDGMSGYIARLQVWGTEAGATFAKSIIALKMTSAAAFGKMTDEEKQAFFQRGVEQMTEIDKGAESQIDKSLKDFMERGKKLQEAMDAKKGGAGAGGVGEKDIVGGAQKALNEIEKEQLANRQLILAVTQEYDSAMDATMSKEEQQAAQREAINQRLLLVYDKETAALMTKNLMVAQAQKQQEQYSISFYNNALKEYAVTKNIGDAMVAATKQAVAEKIKAIGQEEAVAAGRELWDGFGALARYDLPSAGNHFIAAAGHAANAALAGAASVAVSGGGGASAGGGASSVAQGGINSAANIPQEQQSTLIVDTKNLDWKERQLAQTIMTQIFDEFKNKGQRFPSNVVIQ